MTERNFTPSTASPRGAAPAPTYAPAVLALGITLALWGLITTLALSAVGAVLAAGALWRWVEALRHD